MSVWLQTLGEFFWVFIMSDSDDLELYKVMGETAPMTGRDGQASGLLSASDDFDNTTTNVEIPWAMLCALVLQTEMKFFSYDVKPVPIKMMRFSTWHQKSGLYIKDCHVFLLFFFVCQKNYSWLHLGRKVTSTLRTSCSSSVLQTIPTFNPRSCTCGDVRPGQRASSTCWTHRQARS